MAHVYSEPNSGFDWGEAATNPLFWLGAAGTGLGIYGSIANQRQARDNDRYGRRAYETNLALSREMMANTLAQQRLYNEQLSNFYGSQNAWRSGITGQMMGLINQAMAAQNEDPRSSYAPMSDAAAKAMRRGITAQQALRTGGNEGALVDALVGEGMAKTETDRYEAATRLDAILNQNRTSLYPSMLSALASVLGASGPVAPLQPLSYGFPPLPNYAGYGGGGGGGASGSFGGFGEILKYLSSQRAFNSGRHSNWDRGPADRPTVYTYPDWSEDPWGTTGY